MLKSIEIWNFESHEHTLIDGLSTGLNLICGESNAGKTSIVRALRLVAYNKFDPKSLRVGAKWCRVKVTSDKGVVQVTRGPDDNLWEITENGKPTKHLDKVGVVVVPEACKVIGLTMVRLGDTDVPVNIMEQLESHFMLAGIGDEKATGSIRAQIIDEISGLSGIEVVIKSVSLDNTRYGREVKNLEKDIDKTNSQLHDQNVLDREARVLEQAEKLLQEREDYLLVQAAAETVIQDFEQVVEKVKQLEAELSVLPDVKAAQGSLDVASDGFEVVSEGTNLVGEVASVKKSVTGLSVELGRIGDVKRAESHIVISDSAVAQAQGMRHVLDEKKATVSRLNDLTTSRDSLPDESVAQVAIEKCVVLVGRMEACASLLSDHEGVGADLTDLDAEMKNNKKELVEAFKERDEILKSVTICPINLGPVSQECLKGIRTPVIEELK